MIKKILIVDDSVVARMGLKKAISKDVPYEFYEASDGASGLEQFKAVAPDVTFLDLTMPVMTGFQALDEIKKIDKNAAVIVVTADIQKKTIDRVLEAGALLVISKPPSQEKIRGALEKARKFKEGVIKR
ncbi:MAG: response regulator [Planctomycetes bacterium]|nr:response regulator [Planctomycetota bacterium]